eukprot:TRINITY_DN54055_c0_g1_i1.p1 TRINITY_DN54055_c0_g1~~TRINITY_DN54055_c0_g1_i1.p1  ORF type:complete len:631 (-),score=86.88 TRINITY_DN54055_c0_g1_i1:171-2021(-)
MADVLPGDMTVEGAKHILARARESHSAATQARKDAATLVDSLKETVKQREAAVDKLDTSIKLKSSLDEKWEEFRAKFDRLNELMVEKMRNTLSAQIDTRPAELISEARVAQVLRRAERLVVLTGAGISAESGVPTFRGSDGYWTVGSENYRPQELATWAKYDEMPEELWKWYQYRWGLCTRASPNPGHYALVELDRLKSSSMQLVTQNIDGLHLLAGSDPSRLCEIHGRIDEMRCDEHVDGACLHKVNMNASEHFQRIRATVQKTPKPAKEERDERVPRCCKCGVRQRPKILWFDECYNEALFKSDTAMNSTQACDVLLIIGTQLTTGLPHSMVQTARKNGSIIIKMDTIVDLEDPKCAGMLHVQAKSGEALPRIIMELKELQKETVPAPLASVQPCTPPSSKPGTPPKSGARQARSSSSSTTTTQRRASSTSALASAKAVPSRRTFGAAASLSLAQNASALKRQPSPARSTMSSVVQRNTPVGFFVYGTLRPDDDSGASWTQSFNKGLVGEAATLPGASLYIDGSYPAVCFEKTRCCVRGVLLTLAGDQTDLVMASKLVEADRIEGYPDLYERTVAMVRIASGNECCAYVYHRTGRTNRAESTCIFDGDWLSRQR